MKLSDLLLSEKEWTEIADKYIYYNTPDCAVKETAKFASLKTAKAIINNIFKDIEQEKMSHDVILHKPIGILAWDIREWEAFKSKYGSLIKELEQI